MAIDPLSSATRTAKRNLLLASLLTIAVRAFNVTIEKIPVAGLSISYDPKVFSFLLGVSLVYFFATFVLYYFIDIRNIETTPHQTQSDRKRQSFLNNWLEDYLTRLKQSRPRQLASSYSWTTNSNFNGAFIRDHDPAAQVSVLQGPITVRRDADPGVYQIMHRWLSYQIKLYKVRRVFALARERIRHSSVSLVYVTRNLFTDGIVPIGVGLFALAALFGMNIDWLQHITPSLVH